MFNKSRLLSLILLVSLGAIWGTGYSIARYATLNGVPPLGYSFWQSLGPAMLLFLIWSAFPKSENLSESRVQTSGSPAVRCQFLIYFLICGLTGIAIPNTNMYLAAPHLPAGILAVVVNTVPIIAYPLALYARVEKFDFLRLIGVFFALCGLMCLVLPKTSLPAPQMLPWVFSSLITPLSFAFCSVYIARFRPANSNSLLLAAGTLIASTILLIPLVWLQHSFYLPHWPFNNSDWVILLEIILSSVGYVIFFQLIKIAGPVYYSLVDTIVSLTGLFWGYFLFAEKLNLWSGTAVALIILSLIIVTQRQRKIPLKKEIAC